MLRIRILLFVCLGIFISNCQQKTNETITAELFGPNVISSELPEFAFSINKAQNQIYFNRTTADRSSMQIMVSDLKDEKWSVPKPLPFSTGEYSDVDPFLTVDGDRLYFSSTRPKNASGKSGVYNTWYLKKNKDQWSDPILAPPPINSDSTEIFISLAKNGNAYFVSERSGKRGILKSQFKKGTYLETEPVILTLHGDEIYASNPAISYDESFLVVAARDPNGNGAPDLFVSLNKNNQWSPLINLGPLVNSDFAEFAPGLSKDQKTLYFSSERPGIVGPQKKGVRPPGDIYKIQIQALLKDLKSNHN